MDALQKILPKEKWHTTNNSGSDAKKKKTTKAKRDAHFKKHGPKSDDNPSAYKDAPGDKEAREKPMKKSKFTKFVDDIMDERTCWKGYRQQGMKKKGD